MAKFAIYQIQLTATEVSLINEKGHGAVAKHKAKLDMQNDFSDGMIGGIAYEAMEKGYYTHVANIEAIDFNQVFDIGNVGPETFIERLTRMSSVSVGDVIIDEEGNAAVVSSYGFTLFGFRPRLAA